MAFGSDQSAQSSAFVIALVVVSDDTGSEIDVFVVGGGAKRPLWFAHGLIKTTPTGVMLLRRIEDEEGRKEGRKRVQQEGNG